MERYDLGMEKAVERIRKSGARMVCIQLPEGLKPQAGKIADELQKQTKAKILIWLGSDFGACDLPQGLKTIGVDLLISWGHNMFHKDEEGW